MGYDRNHYIEGDLDHLNFAWGVDCTSPSEWCFYREPHAHGFACDQTCPCRTNETKWRTDP